MNVLSVNDYYPPYPTGGAELISHQLNMLLTGLGHKVYVLTTYPERPRSEIEGVEKVYWVPHKDSRIPPLTVLGNNYLTPLRMAKMLVHITSKHRIDVIHAVNGNSALCVKYAKSLTKGLPPAVLSFVSYIHICPFGDMLYSDGAKDCGNLSHLVACTRLRSRRTVPFIFADFFGLFQYFNSMLLRSAITSFDYYLAISDFVSRVSVDRLKIDRESIETLRPTIAPVQRPGPTKAGNGENVVMYVGRLTHEKGIAVLADAIPLVLQDCPRTKFVIVGGGPLMGFLEEALLNRYGKKVLLTGMVPHEKIQSYYQGADIVIIPSIWQEPLALVALESMAHGIPLITSNVGGLKEALGEAGVLIEPGKPEELAASVKWLLGDESERMTLSQKGRERAAKIFNPEYTVRNLEQIYMKVIEQRMKLSRDRGNLRSFGTGPPPGPNLKVVLELTSSKK
jgi:glycosyltransferase involved in cell wall biosynthesis